MVKNIISKSKRLVAIFISACVALSWSCNRSFSQENYIGTFRLANDKGQTYDLNAGAMYYYYVDELNLNKKAFNKEISAMEKYFSEIGKEKTISKKKTAQIDKKALEETLSSGIMSKNYEVVYIPYLPVKHTKIDDYFLNQIEKDIAKHKGVKMQVGFRDLSGDSEDYYLDSHSMPSASTIKIYIGLASNLQGNETHMHAMLNYSSNTSSNVIIDRTGKKNINDYISENGYNDTYLESKFVHTLPYAKKFYNRTSVKDLVLAMEVAEKNPTLSNYMKNSKSNRKIYAKTLDELTHKTGEVDLPIIESNGKVITYIYDHDVAVVEPSTGGKYILAIMTKGKNYAQQRAAINEISQKIYEFYTFN